MKILRQIRNYLCFCGIEKEEYNALKKYAYVSNFAIWRVLHVMMTAVFAVLFVCSMLVGIMGTNKYFYLVLLIYSSVAACLFLFFLKKDSIIAQLIIYLSISVLFLFGCMITQNKPDIPATTFIVLLLIAPMFMIDKPYFMALELVAASIVYIIWMYYVKPYKVWQIDVINIIIYTLVGILLNIVASSIRIREFIFVVRKSYNRQKAQDIAYLVLFCYYIL